MTKLKQIYKCKVCENIVEVIHQGIGQLVCCNQPMELLETKTEDQGFEKHLPVIERDDDDIVIKVGDIDHPMTDDHYIEWIELMTPTTIYRQRLHPGMKPIAKFETEAKDIQVRIYCNVHGLWKTIT
jgi:superoxide reductase